jgi:hypothetical protein
MRQQSIPGSLNLDFSAPFQAHSETSRDAAKSIEPEAASLRGKVFKVLSVLRMYTFNGLTDEEIQGFLDMNPSTERPRRIELVRLGLVEDSGQKRKTASGRLATVWRAVK